METCMGKVFGMGERIARNGERDFERGKREKG